jgi:hypothetical protein
MSDAVLLVLDLGHEGVDVVVRAGCVRASRARPLAPPERAEEGVDAGGHRGEEVGVRGADQAHRRGRAVLLVVGVQDEEQVERLDHLGVTS